MIGRPRTARPRRHAAAVAGLVVATLAAAAGCSSSDAPPPTPTSTAASASSPATSTTPPTSAETSTPATTTTTTTSDARPLAGRVIVVDPGHNGANAAHPTETARPVDAGGLTKPCNTTGAAEGDLTESRFNWETAQRLRTALESAGATVVLTRTSDDGWGPCVDQRGLTGRADRTDALVSIHADGADAAASGFHVIRPATGPTVTPDRRAASAQLADDVRAALVAQGLTPATYIGGGTGIVERSDIATVNRAEVPAVMLESGNLHNPGDLALLGSAAGQQRIADAVTAALVAYFA